MIYEDSFGGRNWDIFIRCVSGEGQGRHHRVQRKIMVGRSPYLGRASHCCLSAGGNIKTKAVGRNSELSSYRG